MVRSHYISQFYINLFRQHDCEHVFVWDKNSSKGFGSAPKNILAETNIYDEKTEQALSELESRLSTIFKGITNTAHIRSSSLSEDEIKGLSEFATTQFYRSGFVHKESRKWIDSCNKEFFRWVRTNYPQHREELKKWHGKTPINYHEYQQKAHQNMYSQEWREGAIFNVLKSKFWQIIVIEDDNQSFVGSDYPLCRHNAHGNNGLSSPDTILGFPISNRCYALAFGNNSGSTITCTADAQLVAILNAMTTTNASRFVFGSNIKSVKEFGTKNFKKIRNKIADKWPGINGLNNRTRSGPDYFSYCQTKFPA